MINSKSMARWTRLSILAMAILLLCSFAVMLVVARQQSFPLVVGQIEKNATAVGKSLSAQIKRPIDYGFPVDDLVGVEDIFREELAGSEAIGFFALVDNQGKTVALTVRDQKELMTIRSAIANPAQVGSYRTVRLDVGQEPVVARLVVGYPVDFIDQQIGYIVIDLILAVIIAFVLVREIGRAFWERNALKPLTQYESATTRWRNGGGGEKVSRIKETLLALRTQIAERLTKTGSGGSGSGVVGGSLIEVRFLVFAVALSEELIRPFFAVFASEVRPVSTGLSPTMLAGIPVAVFMLTLAIVQPLGPAIAQRFDLRKSLMATAALGGVLLGLTGLITDGLSLAIIRGLTGACYGLMLILAQVAVMRITDSRSRAGGLVEISAAIVAAGIVGPAFGGVMNDRFGTLATFILCGGLYFVAVLLAYRMPTFQKGAASVRKGAGIATMLSVMREFRVLVVIVFAAMPARLAAAALLVVVVPLYLQGLNEPASVVGRVLLLYFLAFMVVAPLAAKASDRTGRRKPFIVLGCLVSAIACGAVAWLDGGTGMAVACGLLGVGQAILSAPQLAIVTDVLEHHKNPNRPDAPSAEQGLATFRFVERLGSIAAPFVAAAAVAGFGLRGSVIVLGAILAVGAVGVFLGLLTYRETKTS